VADEDTTDDLKVAAFVKHGVGLSGAFKSDLVWRKECESTKSAL
jgi:hypothetical protein